MCNDGILVISDEHDDDCKDYPSVMIKIMKTEFGVVLRIYIV